MKRYLFIFLALLVLFPLSNVMAQGDVAILSPSDGEAIQGRVVVTGYIKASNVKEYRLEFGYQNANAAGWYLINSASVLEQDAVLGVWDTSAISDGNYNLRLTVIFTDQSTSQFTITDLRVRNYSPIETITPVSANIKATKEPTLVSLLPKENTNQKMENNPTALSEQRYQAILVSGLVIGLVLTFLFSIILIRQRERTS